MHLEFFQTTGRRNKAAKLRDRGPRSDSHVSVTVAFPGACDLARLYTLIVNCGDGSSMCRQPNAVLDQRQEALHAALYNRPMMALDHAPQTTTYVALSQRPEGANTRARLDLNEAARLIALQVTSRTAPEQNEDG